jgi:DNA topoisomerase-1
MGKGKATKKKETAEKPKRQGVPKGLKLEDIDLAAALKLLELPREVGLHPETKDMIKAGIGRFGPFLVHQGSYTSIPKGDDVLTIGINRAVDLIAAKAERAANGGGRRGGWGKKKAKADGDDAAPKKTAAKKKAPAKKAAAKKPAAKKPAAKKPASKKTATKKPAAKE